MCLWYAYVSNYSRLAVVNLQQQLHDVYVLGDNAGIVITLT